MGAIPWELGALRNDYAAKGKLSQERIARLDALGFRW
jgi:hypothetical protein